MTPRPRRAPLAPATFARRRRRLARRLGGGIALLPTAPATRYANDVENRFRPDSDFFYLTGFPEPEAVAILAPAHPRGGFWLLVRARCPEQEVWTGPRAGPDGARSRYGADVAAPIAELETVLEQLLDGAPSLHHAFGRNAELDAVVGRVLERLRMARRRSPPPVVADLTATLHAMRQVKDSEEIGLMRTAAAITCRAHRLAMAHARSGRWEYELQAVLEAEFRLSGATGPAYPSIVGSGPNACVLHYTDNRRRLRPGELVLMDAGCEFQMYCADVTRTVPVSGRFGKPHRRVYDLVLAAQEAAIAAVRPGVAIDAPHRAAVAVLCEGLIDLGVLQGTPREVARSGAYRRYFMHQTSHWLGMDVHDAGAVARDGRSVRLAEGMVLTVEPGLYLSRGDRRVPAPYRGIGVRIEDDVLVSRRGADVLTAAAPKRASAIEKIVRRGVGR